MTRSHAAFFPLLVLLLTMSATVSAATTGDQVGKPAAPAPQVMAGTIKQGDAQGADRHRIELLSDGRARILAPMQTVEAVAAPDGITVTSANMDRPVSFAIHAAWLGRVAGTREPVEPGQVVIDRNVARIVHANLREEFTTSIEGVRQDFIIPAAPGGEGELALELAISGAQLYTVDGNIAMSLPGGRELIYHCLLVTDSTGKTLPARFELLNENRLCIVVADAGAVYPLRIDPTIADINWVSMVQPAATDSRVIIP